MPVIVGAQTRRSVISSPGRNCHQVEGIHGLSVATGEGDVSTGLGGVSFADPKEGSVANPVTCEGVTFGIETHDTKRAQCLIIKFL